LKVECVFSVAFDLGNLVFFDLPDKQGAKYVPEGDWKTAQGTEVANQKPGRLACAFTAGGWCGLLIHLLTLTVEFFLTISQKTVGIFCVLMGS
jgi:hypothetical protein